MVNIEDKVGEAKAEVEKARFTLVEAYLTKIKETYLSLPAEKKDIFVNRLEQIAITAGSNFSKLDLKKYVILSPYDPEVAKAIRQKAELSQKQLANQLGSNQVALSRYESGSYFPKPTTKNGKKYLAWLKEQGYNPYDL